MLDLNSLSFATMVEEFRQEKYIINLILFKSKLTQIWKIIRDSQNIRVMEKFTKIFHLDKLFKNIDLSLSICFNRKIQFCKWELKDW